jgi:NitT/TauT family transport system substrate-binding protein
MTTLSRRGINLASLGLAASALAEVFPSQADSQGSSQADRFRIGVATWIGYGAVYVAKERGFFRGLDVEIQRSDDPNVLTAGMLRGDLDGYCTTLDNFVISAAGGLPGTIVYLFDESAGADGLVVRPEINSLADLRGKQVAAQAGFPSQFFLLYLMQRAGISSTEYKYINLDADKAGAAFVSGRLDAAVTWEPWLTEAREQGKGKLLVTSRDYPGLIVDALVVRSSEVKARPNVIRSLVTGLIDAVEFWKANSAEADAIIARSFSLKPEAVADMLKGVRYLDRDTNRVYLSPDGRATEILSFASQIWRKANLIESIPNLSQAVIGNFVK